MSRNAEDFDFEYRMVRSSGEVVWVHDIVNCPHEDGEPLQLRGLMLDVTELKRGEEALEKERAFLRQVIDIDPNFIFAKDRAGRFTLANRAVADAYGTTVENLIGKTDADFNPNRDEVESFHRMDVEVIDSLQERFIPEETITDAGGKTRWRSCRPCLPTPSRCGKCPAIWNAVRRCTSSTTTTAASRGWSASGMPTAAPPCSTATWPTW